MSDFTSRIKAAVGAAVNYGKEAVQNYLEPDIEGAAEEFNYEESQKKREDTRAAADKINETSKKQRVSSRAQSRANDLARIEGRSDEEKIRSKAIGDRNSKVIKDAALTFAPGGAAGAIAAKAGYVKKGVQLAKAGLKTASKLGKGNVVKGVKAAAQVGLNRAKSAGSKKLATAAVKKGVKFAKYKGKIKAKGYANKAAAGDSSKA
ncbi:MAG: hypothetical protein ACR2M7_04275 [Bdellovibrionales bacterium]